MDTKNYFWPVNVINFGPWAHVS